MPASAPPPEPPRPRYAGWPEEAVTLIERAVAQHGGWPLWSSLRQIAFSPTQLSGLVPRLKGLGHSFPLPARVEVLPHERRTLFRRYPDDQHEGRFIDGTVQIVRTADAHLVAESQDHRRRFTGLAKNRRWQPLDALYFFGYALWHYHAVPFTLGDAVFCRFRRARHPGGALVGLELEFPPELHTHSRRQTFYFDGEGVLRRHDYVADIIGWWARAQHEWLDYERRSGLLVARTRHVRPHLGPWTLPLAALHAELNDVTVETVAG